MSQLITEKENKRFAANTADMTQDDFFVTAILEMCTDPELSKRFREVKTNEACKKEKAKSNGNQKSGNTLKAQQITDAATPEIADEESGNHKVGRTIIYRMTGEDEEVQELSLIHI